MSIVGMTFSFFVVLTFTFFVMISDADQTYIDITSCTTK